MATMGQNLDADAPENATRAEETAAETTGAPHPGENAEPASGAAEEAEAEEANPLDKIPTPFFALPFVYLMRNTEWTPELVTFGQIIVMTEALIVLGAYLYIDSCVENNCSAEKKIWVRPQQYAKTPEDKKQDAYVEVSELDFEKQEVWQAQKSLFISVLVAMLVPKLLGFNQPIMLQSVVIPVSFLRSKLFLKHVLGLRPANPWNAVPEATAKKELSAAGKAPSATSSSRPTEEMLESLSSQDRLEVKYGVQAAEQALENKLASDVQRFAKASLKTEAQVKELQDAIAGAIKANLVDVQNKQTKATYLMALSRHANPEVTALVKDLLEAGADPLKADVDGWTALHWASFHGNLHAARPLLANVDADVGAQLRAAKTLDSSTPLDLAKAELDSNGEDGKAIIELLESGAASN